MRETRMSMTRSIGSRRSRGLIPAKPRAAIDATGFETRRVRAYFGMRRQGSGRRRRCWPKLTAVVHAASHVIPGATIGGRAGPGLARLHPGHAPSRAGFASFPCLDERRPLIVTMRNVASREMLYCASSSGAHFDQRQKALRGHANIVEAIIANA